MTKVVKMTVVPTYHTQAFDVEVVKGKSVKIDVFFKNMHNPRQFTKEFKVGDMAEYDSWNLTYYGEIVSITEKTVTIDPKCGGAKKRLKIADFCYKNYNFDLETVKAENYETSLYI